MRCREVRRRLNEAGEPNPEILEHLKTCRSCSREAEAVCVLESAINLSHEADISEPTSFTVLKSRLETAALKEDKKENSIMSKIKNEINTHPKFSFGIVSAICVFMFLLLVPISYDKTVGYDLTLSGINAQNWTGNGDADDMLKALGYDDIEISIESDGKTVKTIFENLPSKKAVDEITSAMVSMSNSDGGMFDFTVSVSPVVIKEFGSIYAQVRDKIELKVETEGKTDQEVKEEIEKGLKKRGYDDADVVVISKPDGQREIKIDISYSDDSGSKKIKKETQSMTILKDGEAFDFKCTPDVKLNIDTEGKTGEEIKSEIVKELAKKGIKNPNVKIEELKDGRREIRIEVEDDDCLDKDK